MSAIWWVRNGMRVWIFSHQHDTSYRRATMCPAVQNMVPPYTAWCQYKPRYQATAYGRVPCVNLDRVVTVSCYGRGPHAKHKGGLVAPIRAVSTGHCIASW
eukprot:2406998-Rhodomonas_salina.1